MWLAFKTAVFSITVDTNGRILSSKRSSEFAEEYGRFGGDALVQEVVNQVNDLIGFEDPRWHKDTSAKHWFISTLNIAANVTATQNPPSRRPPL